MYVWGWPGLGILGLIGCRALGLQDFGFKVLGF